MEEAAWTLLRLQLLACVSLQCDVGVELSILECIIFVFMHFTLYTNAYTTYTVYMISLFIH